MVLPLYYNNQYVCIYIYIYLSLYIYMYINYILYNQMMKMIIYYVLLLVAHRQRRPAVRASDE